MERPITPPRAPPPRASELSARGLEAKKQASSPKSPSKSSVGATEGEESSPHTTDPTGRSEAGSPSRRRSRTPLKRRPFGNKQRKKFEKGQYGDQRVRFSNPLEVPGGGKGEAGGPPKGKKGKGKKGKAKGEGGKHKGKKSKGGGKRESRSRSPQGGDWQEWKMKLKGSGETPGSMRLWTVRVVRHLLEMPSGIGLSWRRHTLSPYGSGDAQDKSLKTLVYPLPLPAAAEGAFKSILDVSQWKGLKPKEKWSKCKEAW